MKKALLIFCFILLCSSVVLAGGSIFKNKRKKSNPDGVYSIGMYICGSLQCPPVRIVEGSCDGIENASLHWGVCLCEEGYIEQNGKCVVDPKFPTSGSTDKIPPDFVSQMEMLAKELQDIDVNKNSKFYIEGSRYKELTDVLSEIKEISDMVVELADSGRTEDLKKIEEEFNRQNYTAQIFSLMFGAQASSKTKMSSFASDDDCPTTYQGFVGTFITYFLPGNAGTVIAAVDAASRWLNKMDLDLGILGCIEIQRWLDALTNMAFDGLAELIDFIPGADLLACFNNPKWFDKMKAGYKEWLESNNGIKIPFTDGQIAESPEGFLKQMLEMLTSPQEKRECCLGGEIFDAKQNKCIKCQSGTTPINKFTDDEACCLKSSIAEASNGKESCCSGSTIPTEYGVEVEWLNPLTWAKKIFKPSICCKSGSKVLKDGEKPICCDSDATTILDGVCCKALLKNDDGSESCCPPQDDCCASDSEIVNSRCCLRENIKHDGDNSICCDKSTDEIIDGKCCPKELVAKKKRLGGLWDSKVCCRDGFIYDGYCEDECREDENVEQCCRDKEKPTGACSYECKKQEDDKFDWVKDANCCTDDSECTSLTDETHCGVCLNNKCHAQSENENQACCEEHSKKYCSKDRTCVNNEACCSGDEYSDSTKKECYECVENEWKIKEGSKCDCPDGGTYTNDVCCKNGKIYNKETKKYDETDVNKCPCPDNMVKVDALVTDVPEPTVTMCCSPNSELVLNDSEKYECCLSDFVYQKDGTKRCCSTKTQYDGFADSFCCELGEEPVLGMNGGLGCCPVGSKAISKNGEFQCCPSGTEPYEDGGDAGNWVCACSDPGHEKDDNGVCCASEQMLTNDGKKRCCSEGKISVASDRGYQYCCAKASGVEIKSSVCCVNGNIYNSNSGQYTIPSALCGACPDDGEASKKNTLFCCKDGKLYNSRSGEYDISSKLCGDCPTVNGKTGTASEPLNGVTYCCLDGKGYSEENKSYSLVVGVCGCPEDNENSGKEGTPSGIACCSRGFAYNRATEKYDLVTPLCSNCPDGGEASSNGMLCCKDGHKYDREQNKYSEEISTDCPCKGGEWVDNECCAYDKVAKFSKTSKICCPDDKEPVSIGGDEGLQVCCSVGEKASAQGICCPSERWGQSDGENICCPEDQKWFTKSCCEPDDLGCICQAEPANVNCPSCPSGEKPYGVGGICCKPDDESCICNADPQHEICLCPSGQKRVDGECCDSDKVAGTGDSQTCCGSDEEVIGGKCCNYSKVAWSEGTKICCGENEESVNGECCTIDKIVTSGRSKICCGEDETVVGDQCCASDKVAGSGSSQTCCGEDEEVVGDQCCASGDKECICNADPDDKRCKDECEEDCATLYDNFDAVLPYCGICNSTTKKCGTVFADVDENCCKKAGKKFCPASGDSNSTCIETTECCLADKPTEKSACYSCDNGQWKFVEARNNNYEECGCPNGGTWNEDKKACCKDGYIWAYGKYSDVSAQVCGCPDGGTPVGDECCKDGFINYWPNWNGEIEKEVNYEVCEVCPAGSQPMYASSEVQCCKGDSVWSQSDQNWSSGAFYADACRCIGKAEQVVSASDTSVSWPNRACTYCVTEGDKETYRTTISYHVADYDEYDRAYYGLSEDESEVLSSGSSMWGSETPGPENSDDGGVAYEACCAAIGGEINKNGYCVEKNNT